LRLGDDVVHGVAGADRDGRFDDDDLIVLDQGRDIMRNGVDMTEIGVPVATARGCSDRDENGVGCFNGSAKIRGESQALQCDVLCHEVVEARLIDRHASLLQRIDLVHGGIDARHGEAKIRKANPGH
jgi:hypothetical protein